MTIQKQTTYDIATALSILLPQETLATVIDCLLTANADARLYDRASIAAERLFDTLTTLAPEATALAMRQK